jgi:multidrug resistance protein, MATE family
MKSRFRDELRPMLRLSVPIVMAEIGWMSMTVVDTIMLGRLPNSAVAIGAASLGTSLFYTVAIFGGGLLLGLDTLVSQAYGRKDFPEANRSLINSIYLAFALTPLMMGVVWLWPPLMRQLGVQPEIMSGMVPFLNALNWGTLPLLLYFALRRYLQAVNMVKPVTFALVSSNVINALFNWVFIYGHWGFRAYGIPGSGWSTCLARIYMALVLVIALVIGNHKYGFGLWQTEWHLEFRRIRNLLALGFPAASQILFEIGVFSAVTALCGKLGALPLAGHQIALNCAAFTFMVPLGMSSAAAVRVGNELGRSQRATSATERADALHSARRAGWMAILLGVGFMACAAMVFLAVPRGLARIFTPTPAVIEMGAKLLLIAAAFQLFDGLQTVCTGALRGAGDTRTPMLANLIAYWLIGLPVGWILCFKFGWGAQGLWIGLCLGLILIGTFLLWVWNGKIQVPHLVVEHAVAD